MRGGFPILLLAADTIMGAGTWVDTSFVPPSLSFENPIAVYLPEGYDPQGSTQYQVTIWLHGWGGHYFSGTPMLGEVHDSLAAAGDIEPCIFASPEGWCPPYNGSMWANSEFYGNYEDYVIQDVIAFIDTNYCTLGDGSRHIMGQSMGGSGALDLSLRHPGLFDRVVTSGAYPDMVVAMPYSTARIILECPESEPPYTYDWGNGTYTNSYFLYSGAYSPNLGAPDSVDFPLDPYAQLVDSVYAEFELHNPAHMVKVNPPEDLFIGLTWGVNDTFDGLSESNYAFADTLEDLGLPHAVFADSSGHQIPGSRMAQMLLLAMGSLGVDNEPRPPTPAVIMSVTPNPLSTTGEISFSLGAPGEVELRVFDIAGRPVRSMEPGFLPAGEHSLLFEASGLPSGVYLIRLETQGHSASTSVLVLR